MLANIAEASSPEQRVGDCVQDDVGIAVAREPAAGRHFDTAEHERPFAGKGVDVEAHAGSRREPTRQPLLGTLEVRGAGELLERGIALDRGDVHPRSTDDTALIGGRGA